MTWGVTYILLAPLLIGSALSVYFPLFMLAGTFSVVASLSRPAWFGRLAFVLLTIAPTALSLAFWVALINKGFPAVSSNENMFLVSRALLWWTVAVNHYIISGWPESRNRSLGEPNSWPIS